MGILARLFGAKRRPPRRRRRYVLRSPEEDIARTRRWAAREARKKESTAERAMEQRPGHVLLRRGVRYRWTLRFASASGAPLTDAQLRKLLDSMESDPGVIDLRTKQRNPLVLSYSTGRQPVTTNVPLRKQRPFPGLRGVRETTLRIVAL